MPRVIKFRAWDEGQKVMFEPDLCVGLVIHLDGEQNSLDQDGDLCGTENTKQLKLLQFTGMLDRNGREIYEGDIVKAVFLGGYSSGFQRQWHVEKVRYLKHRAGFYPMTDCKLWRDGDDGRTSSIEVIGNVFENPELLEASNERN